MMKTLYLMRHGQTRFNVQKRIQGASDSPLTELGIQQAQEAKQYFADEKISFDVVYASTQERAGDTAQIVSGRSDIIRLKGLKEMDFGSYEAQPEYLNPPLHTDGTGYRDAFVFFGGEDTMVVRRRMVETVTELMNGLPEGSQVLAVSHGAAIAQFFRGALEEAPDVREMSNCAILKFTYDQGKFDMHYIYNPTQKEFVYHKS
ncbi:histidine phosphatase family protein [Streptococcus sobrinus]|uniref:histidine phosphatase family protein n=1 Tax=Streptococcus sobrinus TaxID=1310 RepID=UPI0018AB76E1|nr:histidine phosphatase family protein [Streptococcus sobrinus]